MEKQLSTESREAHEEPARLLGQVRQLREAVRAALGDETTMGLYELGLHAGISDGMSAEESSAIRDADAIVAKCEAALEATAPK
jgi:hypothetical protein